MNDPTPVGDPIEQFVQWMEEAAEGEPSNHNACALATADGRGRPSVRMVLLKGVDDDGFVFYTNLGSRKGRELSENPWASLCFHWKSLDRQVRVDGPVEPVSDADADEYFESRPRASRIGAWASKQSQTLDSRFALEKRVATFGTRFAVGPVPRPEFWSGFRLRPERIEFWREMPFRLHERIVFERAAAGGWTIRRLFP